MPLILFSKMAEHQYWPKFTLFSPNAWLTLTVLCRLFILDYVSL